MIKNYFKSALRNFLKNKVMTMITILGLSIGISAALVIYQVVQYDYSFDTFEPDGDRIYRIVSEGQNWKNSGVPAPLHEAVQLEVAGISTSAAFFSYNDPNTKISVSQGNDQPGRIFKKQEKIVFADGSYFDIFPHHWLAGNAATSLQAPYQVVISKSRAERYFPDRSIAEVIGQEIIINDTLHTLVSGVVDDLGRATDFDNEVFIALSTISSNSGLKSYFNWDRWDHTNSVSQAFIKLSPGTSVQQVEKHIKATFQAHATGDEYADQSTQRLQALSDIHFNVDFNGTANKSTLFYLILLAVFLLLLGAINFINLSTAQASQRAKEVGVRKTLGSSKSQLIAQFLSETALYTFFATVVSVLIAPLLLRMFSGFIPEGLTYTGVSQLHIIIFLVVLIVVVSLLSGFYPALILSKFKPASAMKNQAAASSGTTRSSWVRKTLIVTQFVIAQVFIIGVLVVNKQIHFSLQKDMGFRKDAIINFDVPVDFRNLDNKRALLLDKIRAIPEVQAASLGGRPPVMGGNSTGSIQYIDGKKEIQLSPDSRYGDTAFLDLYQIKLLAGRNILPSDSITEILINEKMAHRLGFQQPAEALGKFIEMDKFHLPIVGIMADFSQASVHTPIHPLIYYPGKQYGRMMHVALQPDIASWKGTIAQIQAAWEIVYPEQDFEYSFLDQTIAGFYQQDVKVSKLLAWSAGIAILISCLGLLGLVIFLANQRTKEIGIRKVLGASVAQIIALLSKDFIQLVMLAFVIAIPIAWWSMNKWLQNFAYHTTLSWWIFVMAGVIMLLIALVILSIRAGKAAMMNPVKSLRTE